MTSIAEYPSTETADGLLVRAHLAGDEQAFDALYRRYFPDVRRYLHGKTNDLTVAEDIAQDTMLRALRYLHTFDPSRPLWPWLKQIATNLLYTERQRRSGEVLVEEVDRGVALLPDGSDAVVSRDAVVACLAKLPKRQSRALVMRYVEDRDSNDIAALFDLSRNALEQLILRGKTGFKKEYRAQNGAPLLPGFAVLLAKVRRILTGIETRVSAAAGSPMFASTEIAVSAALTVSGLGLVAAGLTPSAPPIVEALGPNGITSLAPGSAQPAAGDSVVASDDRRGRPTPVAYDVAAGTTTLTPDGTTGAPSDTGTDATGGSAGATGVDGTGAATGGAGATAAEVQDEVEQQEPKSRSRTPKPPDQKPADVNYDEKVGLDGVAGASVATETTTDPDDGTGSSVTSATVSVVGEEESVTTHTDLGDADLCPVPGCGID